MTPNPTINRTAAKSRVSRLFPRRALCVNASNKYKTEITLIAYWLLNAANTVYLSREIGYYPSRIRAQAQLLAYSKPYPWPPILVSWVVLAIATAGIYLILRKATHKVRWLLIYSATLFVLMAVGMPTDVGGVWYAIAEYPAFTFLITFCWGAFSLIKNRGGNV